MILFLVGILIGICICVFVEALILCGDEEPDKIDICRDCPYKLFDDGSHDCARCHETVTS